jgi:hypothetical protein
MEEDDVEIGGLLAAAIRAIQDAQINAEREYLSFLLDYGLEEVKEKVGNREVTRLRLREISFDMARQVSDPANPGAVVETTATVRAPLLSLVQMPAIGIDEATIALDLDVQTDLEATRKDAADIGRSHDATLRPQLVRRALPVIKGAVGRGSLSRKTRKHGKLSVKLTLKSTHDDDVHSRLVRLVGEGLSATVELPEPKR